MINRLNSWINSYFYSPNLVQKFISFLLVPLSLVYSFCIIIKKSLAKKRNFEIPIINVGNLVLGGSGKTPLALAIYRNFSPKVKCFIILRGYKRESKGLKVISCGGKILESVKISGDEAMEYALNGANVIVSENRYLGIEKALNLGAGLVILDDGFSKFHIEKFEILLKPYTKPYSSFTIPSGVYRYPKSFYKFADFIPEAKDITSLSRIENESERMVLVTAIANPKRLEIWHKKCVGVVEFSDHYSFKKDELLEILDKFKATSLLVTMKDYAKIKDFGLNLSIIKLEISLSDEFLSKIQDYIDKIQNKQKR